MAMAVAAAAETARVATTPLSDRDKFDFILNVYKNPDKNYDRIVIVRDIKDVPRDVVLLRWVFGLQQFDRAALPTDTPYIMMELGDTAIGDAIKERAPEQPEPKSTTPSDRMLTL